jgi:hypothetical protein
MADQDKEKQLDQLLDSVLSQYSAVEPRPGLETRIMARIVEPGSASSRRLVLRWLWAGAAATALAAIIIFGFFARPAMRTQPSPNRARTLPTPSLSPAPIAKTSPERIQSGHIRPAQRTSAAVGKVSRVNVRQLVFPTPVPLSEQEILLLRYLSRTPRQELLAQSHPDPPPDDAALEDGSALFPGISDQRFSNQ